MQRRILIIVAILVCTFIASTAYADTIYLPLTTRAEATPTPKPTPAPLALLNGNFDNRLYGWVAANATYVDGAVFMGGSRRQSTQLAQVFTVPQIDHYLRYEADTESSQATCGYDKAYVRIYPAYQIDDDAYGFGPDYDTIQTVDVFCKGSTYSNRFFTLDLSAYAGKNVAISFEMYTNINYSSYWTIDNVSLVASK